MAQPESNQPQSTPEIDSATALQQYFDRIPVSSISGIKSALVLEVKTGDCVKDAIRVMFKKNVDCALIADVTSEGFPERFIGFVHLSSLLLWCIQEIGKLEDEIKCIESEGTQENVRGILSFLEQNPHIGQTKVGELGKTFLWDPYFPVGMRDTLFHVLLLLSKHRLQAVPVVQLCNSHVVGFITQNAVIHMLLESSGLEWFDSIVDKVISKFRFHNEEHVLHVYGDQNIMEAFQLLWEKQMGAVAVTDRESKSLIGCLRNSDTYLLLEKEDLFQNRKRLTVKEFMHMESSKEQADSNPTVKGGQRALTLSSARPLVKCRVPNMHTPVTIKRDDTLKQVMKTMAETNSCFSFLVNSSHQATGILTVGDVITQFAPPCMDSTIQGGGFFESALEHTGCQRRGGVVHLHGCHYLIG
ncbi:SNF1-related protein kinase regulatory subunit gamma-1, partial [Cucurbita argyrosperma subsp. sororia]